MLRHRKWMAATIVRGRNMSMKFRGIPGFANWQSSVHFGRDIGALFYHRTPLNGFCLCLSLVLMAAIASAACGADPTNTSAEEFDRLFGDQVRRVKLTATVDDDLQLAQSLLNAAKTSPLEPAMFALVCVKVGEVAGASTPQGFELTITALDLLAERDQSQRASAQERALVVMQQRYNGARGEERLAVGKAMLERLRDAGQGALPDDPTVARGHYLRAITLATSIDREAVAELRQCVLDIDVRIRLNRQVDLLSERLRGDPADQATRQSLVELLVIELDDPANAERFLSAEVSEPFRLYVPLAARDCRGASPEESMGLGDWYLSLAQRATGTTKARLLQRAASGYKRFLALHRQDDLEAVKARGALASIEASATASPPGGAKTVDLLPRINIRRDAVEGNWTQAKNGITVQAARGTRLTLPVIPQGDYELTVRASHIQGGHELDFMLPVGRSAVTLLIGGDSGTTSGLGDIGGVPYMKNSARVSTPNILSGKGVHEVVVIVRTRGDSAQVSASVDGKPLLNWVGKQSELKPDKSFKPAHPDRPGIGAFNSGWLFQSCELRMLSGKAKPVE